MARISRKTRKIGGKDTLRGAAGGLPREQMLAAGARADRLGLGFGAGESFRIDDNRLSLNYRTCTMIPSCPHCHEPLSKRQVARLLASLSAGKSKNYSEGERALRRERMREINARRRSPGSGSTMRHRHLTHQGFTLAAIDDVIGRGRLGAWASLREAVERDGGVRAKVLSICAARAGDPYAQRYHFWSNYARQETTS